MDLILFGMQGSGKGTQGRILAEKYDMEMFEMGHELRTAIQSESPLGLKIKETVESGNLVDDDTIMEVVEEKLNSVSPSKPLLFDGIPRTMAQSKKLLELLERHNRTAFGVFIKVSKDEAIKRMLSRGRGDDDESTIARRLENYEAQTVPVIKSFYDVDRLIEVDGEQQIDKVSDEMIEKVAYLFT